jgi:glycosyltransferase involved in cell wall biosynthesis
VGRDLRVLLLEPDLHENGAIRVSLDRAARWHAAGAQVTVLVLRRVTGAQAAVPAGLPVVYGTRRLRSGRWAAPLSLPRALWQARRSDVVVAGREVDKALLVAALVAPAARRPLAVTVQSRADVALEEYTSARVRPIVRRALTSAQLAVTVARGIVPGLQHLGLSPARIATVTNGVDVPGLRAAGAQEPAVALPDGPVVVASGRLSRQKGFDLLVRAHARALQEGAPAHALLVLGEGPDAQALQALAAELGVSGSVRLAGFQANPSAVVARADLFVLPSRWEGFPLGLVEAVVLGVPVVAADCVSGPAEVLDDGRYGRLVPPQDVPALATALREHLEAPQDLRERAREGAAAADERFDPQRAADDHLALLTGLAAAGRRAPGRVPPAPQATAPGE